MLDPLDHYHQESTELSPFRSRLLPGGWLLTGQQSLEPRPQIPKHQRQPYEEQPQDGIPRTCPDPRLTELSITRLDPETATILDTDASRRLPRSRRDEHQLPTLTSARPVVPVTLVANTDVDADGLVVGH